MFGKIHYFRSIAPMEFSETFIDTKNLWPPKVDTLRATTIWVPLLCDHFELRPDAPRKTPLDGIAYK